MKTKTTMRLEAYIYGTLALALLSGCTKIEQREAEPVPVSWQVIQDGPSTKAETYNTTDKFLSWAWYLPNGKTWAANRAASQLYINAAEISFVSGENCWRNASVHYYWPKAGALSFFAVSPSSLGSAVTCTAADGIKISNWNVDANQDTDIMVADLATDKSANETSIGAWQTGVPTVFRHKLSQLAKFEFNTLQDYSSTTKFYVTGISLNNIKQKGTYVSGAEVGTTSVKMGKWTRDDSATSNIYNYYDGGTGGTEIVYNSSSYTQVGSGSIMLLPQSFSNPGENPDWNTTPHLRIDYKVGSKAKSAKVSLYELFSGELGMNKQITIRVTFNNEGNLIMWAPDQEDWSDSEFTVIM